MKKLLAVVAILAAIELVAHTHATHSVSGPVRPASAASTPADVSVTRSPDSGGASVVDVDYIRDPDRSTTGTYQAHCRDRSGAEWLVTIAAAQAGRLATGDPCPAGPHQPTPQQQYPAMWSALNAPMPYSGGDPDGPCGQWSAADKADADQMRTFWNSCMAHQPTPPTATGKG